MPTAESGSKADFHLAGWKSMRRLLFLDPTEKNGRTDKREERACEKDGQVDRVKLETGVIHVHPSKGATKMGQRKKFRDVTNKRRQLLERSKGPRQNKDRQQKENRE